MTGTSNNHQPTLPRCQHYALGYPDSRHFNKYVATDSSQATARNQPATLERITLPPRSAVVPNAVGLAHRNHLRIGRATIVDYFADASTSETQQAHTQNKIENNGTSHEMLHITLFAAAFISSHRRVSDNTPSQFPVLVHFVISACCLYFLAEALGGHYISLASIALAMAVSLFEIYLSINTSVFIPYVIFIGLIAIVFFWTALFRVQPAQSANGYKLFVMTSLILKQLLENDVVLMDTYPSSSALCNVQSTLFAGSFSLSVMALWLRALGIAPLNPLRCGSANFASVNCLSILASALFGTGSTLTLVYVVMTAVLSSSTTPAIATIACASFAVCTAAILIKQLRGN